MLSADAKQWPPAMKGDEMDDETRTTWHTYVQPHCVGRALCTRCRAPSKEEKRAGLHRFSALNLAHGRE
jgi:hypothetical protein